MNILIVSWITRKHTNRQHLGTLDLLKDHCECNIYGRQELEPYQDSLKIKILELVSKHNPDVVVCYSGLMLMNYENLFRNITRLKIMIEVDYHDQKPKEQWYRDNGFDYMMYRNGNDTSSVGIPGVWWPWSAPESEFYDDDCDRHKIIGFAGSTVHRLYTVRRRARDILVAQGLLEDRKKTILQTEYDGATWTGDTGKYQEYMRSVKGFLTSTENRGPFAKTFEAMASKTLVLSSPIINKDLLFGDCYVEYKSDCTDLVKQARFLLNEDLSEIKEQAYLEYLEKHTRKKRAKELHDNIKLILEGKEPVRRWGF